MPQKNAIKEFVPESYYHIFARGPSKQKIFIDVRDYKYFIGLLERYLGKGGCLSKTDQPYPCYYLRLDLMAYVLIGNHFHLLVYQHDSHDIEKFMRSLMTSYSRYFNLRHKRTGPVFESRYKAKRIDQQNYLEHISRYIHLNPRHWRTYKFSSIHNYLDGKEDEWLKKEKIMTMFSSVDDYDRFVSDYQAMKQMFDELKLQVAG